ncbi:MAG: preprotein translocase subunit SecE [Pirellulales bacterium]|nr:preprotein translocase subunit SecE [Pirellulales bacterium]MBX3431833.1 preprotein translocase subunit SecE [Pirellulales bacterium]
MAELIAGMFNGSRYKRSQGRVWRQITFLALAGMIAVGAWRLSSMADVWRAGWLTGANRWVAVYGLPGLVLAAGIWGAFRIVNYPKFADFLISVEAEMNKVSWPSRGELYRASLVVVVVIFLLVTILFAYDLILKTVISWFLGA